MRPSWIRYTLLLPLFCLAIAIAYNASVRKVPVEEIHKPSPLPDRIILTWAGDPATTQAVTWRTEAGLGGARAQIAEAEDGPGFAKKAKDVAATTSTLETNLGKAAYHSAQFTGLKPSTMYAYRVGDGENWSEWNQFRTVSDKPEPLTFLYGGDAQNDLYSLWSRVIRMAYSTAPEARFIIHAGDLVNRYNRDEEWGEWFNAASWINRTMPSIAAPGNHEYGRDGDRKVLTPNWRHQFTFPENGVAGLPETCYYLDIQGVRVVSLNSNINQEEQAAWLDSLLSKNPNRWTVITFHHPIFSTAKGRDNKDLREVWKPVFDKYAVDMVLQGHDHTYGRGNLISGMNMRSDEGGTMYVVSVMGPKMYGLTQEPWMRRAAEDTQLFQIIRIDGDMLRYEARTARGVLYDAFELRKRGSGRNQLIDRAPATPENRRGSDASGGL